MRKCKQARAITPTPIDCISVCMTGELTHNWHGVTGHVRVVGADFGAVRSLLMFFGGTEALPPLSCCLNER